MEIDKVKKRLESLKHRIDMLKKRIEFQKVGPEVDTARKILHGLEIKYNQLRQDNATFIPEATSTKKNNSLSEQELSKKLGAIYWIFGSSYEETFSFKNYRIEFLEILPNDNERDKCLMKVKVHIYENDRPLIIQNATIEFWKGWKDSTEVDDIGLSWDDYNMPYNNCHWFNKMAYTLAETWNNYFRNVPIIEAKKAGYISAL